MAARFAHKQFQTATLALHRNDQELLTAQKQPTQPSLIALQRYVGNSGVQRLINSPANHSRTQTAIIHRKGCGCSSCGGQSEEESVSRKLDGSIQRFWGGEEEAESESGGSWFDDAANTVSDWAGGGSESSNTSGGGSSWFGDGDEGTEYQETDSGEEEHHEQQTETEESQETETEESGSWFDDAVDTVKDWFDGGEESEGESSEESGGVMDWIEDWWSGEESEPTQGESGEEVEYSEEEDGPSSGQGACITPAVGHGGGSSGGVSVAGLTKANFKHGKNFSFKGNGAYKKEGKMVEDVDITVNMTYTSNPTISYTITPPLSSLSQCKQDAVNAFTDPSGLLGAHEQQHVDAFKNNYDGSETETFTETVSAAKASAEATAAANKKIKDLNNARETKARTESNNLDPWNKPIPNIDKCP